MVSWLDTNISFNNALSDNGHKLINKLMIQSLSESEGKMDKYYFDDVDFVNEAWLNSLKDAGLYPYVALAVYRREGAHGLEFAHTDSLTTYAALNWVECTGLSEMVWYTPTKDPTMIEAIDTLVYEHDDLIEIDSKDIHGDNMTLVQTNIPHDVRRDGAARLTISVRFRNGWQSWEEAVEFFKGNNL